MTPDFVNPSSEIEASPPSRYRWVICALLFAATAINSIDRQILGLRAIPLRRAFGWSESQ